MTEDVLQDLATFDFPLKDIWISAARFHHQNLAQDIRGLPDGARVLEIGCGAAILMTMLSKENPNIQLEGIEPLADGFDKIATPLEHFQKRGADVIRTTYEDFEPSERYDLVYLVNVLEHLRDWRHFLATLPRFLKPGGRCLVLCPNYDFPFEPHFNLPVIASKSTLARIFRRRIAYVENTYGVHGLWDSLNFVRLSEIKRHLLETPFQLNVRHEVSDRMIERFSYDRVYKHYFPLIGAFGAILRVAGVTRLLRHRRLENLQPYMFLELTHSHSL
ncbi:class I SAM-dependent methyltransferase [Marimonas sp. MJW-29]|uniref:Class I SAM-dependent methyltransferase n=1 Tax=Sulfitobacter sediminis TaxID=3234186 RepID=A0ABV3RTN6_9RHOB